MIEITDKHNCVGCRTCEQACPKQCISMRADAEGFLYPEVDADLCVNCHVCEKVCPVLNGQTAIVPLKTIGCRSNDKQTQMASSSGGIFSELASMVLLRGGMVYGAAFDGEFNVRHIGISTIDELDAIRRSKYVQSDTVDTFSAAKEALDGGKVVLYAATPCQVKALKLFLRKPYDNLLTVDFACHGVPSPKVWSDYLAALTKSVGVDKKLCIVNFRSKKKGGWHKFSLEFTFRDNRTQAESVIAHYPGQNAYYQLFFQNISLRPSCFKCPAKGFTSGSDITLCDFWGIQNVAPQRDDNAGVSLVFANSQKGCDCLAELDIDWFETDLDAATKSNKALFCSVVEPMKRKAFFANGIPTFTMRHLNKYSGLDTYGRVRRWLIEQYLKIAGK